MTMVYDGDGNRVSETAGGVTTQYLIDTLNPTGYSQVMDEIVNGAVTRTYTYGLQRISENQLVSGKWVPSFYGYDGHGNARFLANSSGSVTDSYTYDAFGMQIASTGTTANNFRYTGEWLDPSLSFYNLRARYYNQATGRFETMDLGDGDIFVPATLHKYVYTANDPVNEADPSGQSAILEYQWLSTVKNRIYQLGLHSAHHPFTFKLLGILYCVHLQLDYWTPGVSGSNVNVFRFPLFPLCSDTFGVPF